MTIDKEQRQLQTLKERFSYMFTGPHLGLDLYRGWMQDFTDASEQIDRLLGDDKRGFRFTQIKEKYGWARYYFSTHQVTPLRLSICDGKGVREITTGLKDGDDVEKKIVEILGAAEVASLRKCIVCGSPGTIQKFRGWDICACEKHDPAQFGDHMTKALLL